MNRTKQPNNKADQDQPERKQVGIHVNVEWNTKWSQRDRLIVENGDNFMI